MIPFPSIGQFRNTIKAVHERHSYAGKDEQDNPIYKANPEPLPVVSYIGTVKSHGTNASIGQHPDGTLFYQSRNRVLHPPYDDNMGFGTFCLEVGAEIWKKLFQNARACFGIDDTVILYGEWCGSSIQKGVALTKIPEKQFIVFAVAAATDGIITEFIPPYELREIEHFGTVHPRIHWVYDFPTYRIDIDFNNPQLSQNDLVSITEQVEKKCPIGLAFGVEGVGEGVVWRPLDNPDFQDSRFWFKVKGEEHSASKVKVLAEVDLDKLQSISDLVATVLTESRLQQGVAYLKEMQKPVSQKSTGDFLKWITNDVLKEEGDRISTSELPLAEVNKQIGTRARQWYFAHLEE